MKRRSFLTVCSAAALSSLAACTTTEHGRATRAAGAAVSGSTAAAVPAAGSLAMLKAGGLQPPAVTGKGSLAPSAPAGATPSAAPVQAGPALVGHPLPTSQWWTSALVGKLSLAMWAVPVALQVSTAGVLLSGAAPTVMADHIVTPFLTDLTVGSTVSSLKVTDFGAFHVELTVTLVTGGAMVVTLVQGSPIVHLRFTGGATLIAVTAGATTSANSSTALVTVSDRKWVLAASAPWISEGTLLRTAGEASIAIGLAPVGADAAAVAAWTQLVSAAVADPVTSTSSTVQYDPTRKVTRQTLAVTRASGKPSAFVLMPHHRRAAVGATKAAASLGIYKLAVGDASVISASELTLEFAAPDPAAKLATVTVSSSTKADLLAAIRDDLADAPGGGGSYNDGKEMGRLATIAEVARVIGAATEQTTALARLKTMLVQWLTYSGNGDAKYFAYEPVWGGIVGVPVEYGSQDYNDHHFHYGYMVRAAAILAESDAQFLTDYASMVDLLVDDYAGSATTAGLPEQRTFQPYLGHAAASGLVPFADGNNQESSSEAIQAWHAMARWGAVRGNAAMTDLGRAYYALETTTALLYWLGETTGVRPAGYTHTVVGIVWDAKLDFATWFSPMPEAIFGIQLIPLNEGSVYRANRGAAQIRSNELGSFAGGAPRMWGDLFVADLAVADPVRARKVLAAGVPREPSTGRAITRYWVELQAATR